MTDIHRQYKVLYQLYNSLEKGEMLTYNTLKQKDDLLYTPPQKFSAELTYLVASNYIEKQSQGLVLTAKGIRTIESLSKKFIEYMKEKYASELSVWISQFDYYKNQTSELVTQVYFRIQNEPGVGDAFRQYLEDLGRIDDIDAFEVRRHDIRTLIDDIFRNMDEVNRLFENKFKCKLFCPPLASQSSLNSATRGKEINFTDLVATIGLIIHEICHKDIDKLLISKQNGSVNKITTLLDEKGINYDMETVAKLRALYHIRNKTFPLHEAGSEVIDSLKKVAINFPISDYKDAAYKLLTTLNLCLLEMKKWLR